MKQLPSYIAMPQHNVHIWLHTLTIEPQGTLHVWVKSPVNLFVSLYVTDVHVALHVSELHGMVSCTCLWAQCSQLSMTCVLQDLVEARRSRCLRRNRLKSHRLMIYSLQGIECTVNPTEPIQNRVYSGTSLIWTPLGPFLVPCLVRCPDFRG